MKQKTRGRPSGSSPHKEADDQLLRQAAFLLANHRVKSATEAFREVAGDNESSAIIRRLQRRWKQDGERFIADIRSGWWDQLWQKQEQDLKEASPDLHAKIMEFANSEGGAEVLKSLLADRPPSSLMSLGIVKLWDLVEEHCPASKCAADKAFEKAFNDWKRFGTPQADFLRQFARRCRQAANQVEDQKAPGQGEES